MNYMNVRILCGLVRPLSGHWIMKSLREEKNLLSPDNVVRRRGTFYGNPCRPVRDERKKIADYVLVKLEEKERHKVSDSLSRIIRAADVIGEGTDGNLYVLLTQVNLESFSFVETWLVGTGSFLSSGRAWGDRMGPGCLCCSIVFLCLIAAILMYTHLMKAFAP